ncbi:pyridoxamine 5'-phosphate oxidase family protein [Terriglobus tenax]|uniref:pyridoxamine 5'-phosphate oxidase family protein n=1 Tax=Terriglobus tenax TaxID=1111115 RepID=UPI0021DFDBC1|nr:pyridoxamine 5'-phosphate oxidase family protein [Terriglobus tenax]
MGKRYAELAFTPLVQKQQEQHGSRRQYERVQQTGEAGDRLGEFESDFVAGRDGFYLASISETGWPYVQYRGGANGFLRVLDDRTLGFVDLRGNKQYISIGNLQHDDRVALFLMDYAYQRRLKILGHAKIFEGTAEAAVWIEKLRDPEEKTPAERAIIVHIEAFDWNCPQHITPRYTQQEIATAVEPLRHRLDDLEKENAKLRAELKSARPPRP